MAVCLGGGPAWAQGDPNLAPLDLVLDGDLEAIRQAADKGETDAHYAMSIVTAHALLGQPLDPVASAHWRRSASTSGQTAHVTVSRIEPMRSGEARVGVQQTSVDARVRQYDMSVNACLGVLYGLSDQQDRCGQTREAQDRRITAWRTIKAQSVTLQPPLLGAGDEKR